MIASRGHARAVGDEHVRTSVQLIPFIQHGSFRIAAHPATAHFMDVEPRRLAIITRLNVVTAGNLEHRLGLRAPVANHFLIVVIVADGCNE